MSYTTEEALKEVRSRSEKIRQKRENRALGWFSFGICGILFALTLAVASVPKLPPGDESSAAMGSFLLSPEAGGYVLAIVVAFVLGVTVTLLTLRYRKARRPEEKKPQSNDVEETT